MVEKLKNIIKDVAQDFLETSLALRYDICTCNICKNDMLAYILSRLPAQYVTTEQGALHTVGEQGKLENREEIARVTLAAIETISNNPRHNLHEDKKQTFRLLLDKIFEERRLDFRHYREETLKRRVAIRMKANNVDSYSAYLRILIKKPEEYEKLFEILCINVSEFFRDPPIWITIRYLFEKLLKEKAQRNDKNIRVWSAGCASGEEPYSLAILLWELLKNRETNFAIEIYATDIDREALKIAETAKYEKGRLKNVEEKYLKSYFAPLSDGRLRLKEEIKNMVQFQPLDLIREEGLKNCDIVICRNVFIYFNRSLQEQLLMKFYHSLNKDGYLVMGKAEIIFTEAREIFKDIDINARIYQKK